MTNVDFSACSTAVGTYERFELEVRPAESIGRQGEAPPALNPFVDARLEASVSMPDGSVVEVDGFCDSDDGSVYRLRFMPKAAGRHKVVARFLQSRPSGAPSVRRHELEFTAVGSGHPGMIELDPDFPNHFRYSQSGEHYFWNGTTAYYLMGWEDDSVVRTALSRLAAKRVNRVRVLIYGRQYDRPWGQPVVQNDEFKLTLNPWPARYPDDRTLPEFDLTRYNVPYWRRYEGMLAAADALGIQVSACFFIGGQPLAVPFGMWSEDEYRYYRYAVARLASFPNLTWDLGNEHDFHRGNLFWVNAFGTEVRRWDPYGHICGIHNRPYYAVWDGWLTAQLHQEWDAGRGTSLREHRRRQAESGRVVPQVIEEYGYEDLWEKFPGQRSAETRRRVAWEIAMAGCYQTNGESARTGTGVLPDSGGGWVTGRGDDSMVMFDSISHMVDFFTSFDWWRLSPQPERVMRYRPDGEVHVEYWYRDGRRASDLGAQLLGAPDGAVTVVYLPYGGTAEVRIPTNAVHCTVSRFEPATGRWTRLGRPEPGSEADAGKIDHPGVWTSPWTEGPADVAYLLGP